MRSPIARCVTSAPSRQGLECVWAARMQVQLGRHARHRTAAARRRCPRRGRCRGRRRRCRCRAGPARSVARAGAAYGDTVVGAAPSPSSARPAGDVVVVGPRQERRSSCGSGIVAVVEHRVDQQLLGDGRAAAIARQQAHAGSQPAPGAVAHHRDAGGVHTQRRARCRRATRSAA